jgi:uncharacterized BrkB/YihY/UPF0761 family membrane protein
MTGHPDPEVDGVEGSALPHDGTLGEADAGLASRAAAYSRGLLDRREESPFLDMVLRMFERHREIAGSLLAGALGYRRFLVTLPLTLIAIGLLGFGERTTTAAPEDVARTLGISGMMARIISTTGVQAESMRWVTLLSGVVLLLWTTLALMRALRTVHALA